MNYEQKYKEVLNKAQKELQCCDTLNCDAAKQIFRLFPELAESEDEKIRKTLIEYINGIKSWGYFLGISREQMISWLEKQGEQKYDIPNTPIKDSEVVTSRMKYIDENLKQIAEFVMDYANWDLRKDEWNHPVATVPLFRVLDALVQNGKQYSEEYSVVDNNTKPKSDIENGKWYVCDTPRYTDFEVGKAYYCHKNGMLRPNENEMARYVASHCFHLWTIEDANDGDVLATEYFIFIFKNVDNDNGVHYYCLHEIDQHEDDEQFGVALPQSLMGRVDNNFSHYSPASKEQRDLLFQKIKEAGYTWNAEKKELIKNI